jgi:hypothetical protein
MAGHSFAPGSVSDAFVITRMNSLHQAGSSNDIILRPVSHRHAIRVIFVASHTEEERNKDRTLGGIGDKKRRAPVKPKESNPHNICSQISLSGLGSRTVSPTRSIPWPGKLVTTRLAAQEYQTDHQRRRVLMNLKIHRKEL